jgi:hypothetical protein
MGPVVVIPQNYEELSRSQREQVIPICISALDRHGRPIPSEWFWSGVAPVREQLVSMAHRTLGDPWCVSELAEATVHRLWERHRTVVRPYPARLVLKKAMWIAEELKNGGWRKMRYPNLYLALDSLDQKVRDHTLADPKEYAELFEQQIMLDSFEQRLEHEGRTEIRAVYQLIRRGYTWQEVAEHVGARNAECVKRRFYRWIKKAATGLT